MIKILFRKEEGIAMPLVVVIIAIVTLLGFTAANLVEDQRVMGERFEKSETALSIAEAGINKYIWHLNKESDYYKKIETDKGKYDTPLNTPIAYEKGYYQLNVEVPTSEKPVVSITSTGWLKDDDSNKSTIKVEANKRQFVQQVYLSEEETLNDTTKVYWTTGDIVEGPLHTNGRLYIDGNPEFMGRVTYGGKSPEVVKNSEPVYHDPGSPEKVQPLDFPLNNEQIRRQAKFNGYYFKGQTCINIKDNKLSIWNKQALLDAKLDPTKDVLEKNMPGNGVIYVDGGEPSYTDTKWSDQLGNAFVSGTLDGRLTIAAANDIYITGYDPTKRKWSEAEKDITGGIKYKDTIFENGNVKTDGGDMLGLTANRYIRILHYGWFSGRSDSYSVALDNITIHAALFALNQSFEFEKYNDGPVLGTVTLVGSICQKYRGAVGMFYTNNGKPKNGYANKNYSHDPRMAYDTPPHFLEPTNAGWEIVSWKKVTPSE